MKRSERQWIETEDTETAPAGGAGQAGDTQDLPSVSEEAEESVQDLVETGQDFEAELVEGMEDAAAHPEEEATTAADRQDARDSDRD